MKFGFALGDLEDNTYADKRRNSHSSTNNQSVLIFAETQQKQDWGQLIHQLNYQ